MIYDESHLEMETLLDLIEAQQHVASLERDRVALAQTVLHVHRNLLSQSYSFGYGQRMLSAAVHDLDKLDQNLFAARLVKATLEAPS